MKLAKLIWVIGSTLAFSQQRVERVQLSESKQTITGFSGVGEISLSASRVLLDIHFPSGKSGKGGLNSYPRPHIRVFFVALRTTQRLRSLLQLYR